MRGVGGRAFRIGLDRVAIYRLAADQPSAVVVRAQGFLSLHRAHLREMSGTEPRGRMGGQYGDVAKAKEGGL